MLSRNSVGRQSESSSASTARQAQLGFAHHLLEFLVQRFIGARPIDECMDIRKQEHQEGLEVGVEGFLPRAVVVGGHLSIPPPPSYAAPAAVLPQTTPPPPD